MWFKGGDKTCAREDMDTGFDFVARMTLRFGLGSSVRLKIGYIPSRLPFRIMEVTEGTE